MLEKEVHQILIDNKEMQQDLANMLNIDYETMELIHEDQYINLMYADFTILSNKKIRAIVEVKGENINVTDYVRGIGQLYEYEYYKENNVEHLGYDYCEDFNVIYLYPASVLQNNYFNIGTFKYPESTIIVEMNTTDQIIREITKNELKHFAEAQRTNLVSISQYYVRDNRLFEFYLLLQYILFLQVIGRPNPNRKDIEEKFLKKLQTPNNGNWRNAFISLSSLGFINDSNCLTQAGIQMTMLSYELFVVKMYNSYIKAYVKEFYDVFAVYGNEFDLSNQDIKNLISKKWSNKDILFLTESNGRYISSWLNLMRDDFGMISFESRSNHRVINYNPLILNDKELERLIRENSKAYEYIEKYRDILLSEGM